MKSIVLGLLHIYIIAISPILVGLFGSACRFTPTCSMYMYQAIDRFGILKGMGLGLKRFLSCNPFSKGGFDPVPKF